MYNSIVEASNVSFNWLHEGWHFDEVGYIDEYSTEIFTTWERSGQYEDGAKYFPICVLDDNTWEEETTKRAEEFIKEKKDRKEFDKLKIENYLKN